MLNGQEEMNSYYIFRGIFLGTNRFLDTLLAFLRIVRPNIEVFFAKVMTMGKK